MERRPTLDGLWRVGFWFALALVASMAACGSNSDPPEVEEASTDGATVEYIAHAAVVIEASDGTRVLIDPYNGVKWMGYGFPEDVATDAVLVTHPHYDHDAVWHLPPETPVYREPGAHDLGPIRVLGIEGEHAGGQRFRERGGVPWNVIWVIEAGGVRFAHIGDNRMPTAETLEAVGRVDVLFTHPFFPADSVTAAWSASGVKVVVPVHTRLPELAVPSFRLPTADDWLLGQRPIRDVGNRTRYTPDALGEGIEYHVFTPSSAVSPWSDELERAWELAAEARNGITPAADADRLSREAATLGPEALTLQVRWAERLVERGRDAEAEQVLRAALSRTGDIEQTLVLHALLGSLLEASGQIEEARQAYQTVLDDPRTYAAEAVVAARSGLERLGNAATPDR